ncbi:MAG: hypothetical protein ACP5I1_09095, partial [Candidatus Hinthialibacter sp.]
MYRCIASLFLCAALCSGGWCGETQAKSEPPRLGDESDGSRAVPVHRIPLLDEEGVDIRPDDDVMLPFSVRATCALQCHHYETIAGGWHFNAGEEGVEAGRPGHPWIYVDAPTGTQIPLSHRQWEGVYQPKDLGLTTWEFVKTFGRHLPGGGVEEMSEADDPDKVMRLMASGGLEANCLACHDADAAHDQAEYHLQIARENFRWAAAATSGFTAVSGSAEKMPDTFDYLMPDGLNDPKLIPPTVKYDPSTFDSKNQVFFDIVRKPPDERCYFCHSFHYVTGDGLGEWASDEDVHLSAGLQCADCHRNGLDHAMVRGYEGESTANPLAAALSCEGCHLGEESGGLRTAGRLGAPVPTHRGLPAVHFEKLTCTACHSGPRPQAKTRRVKTSMAHGLGTHNVDKSDDALPAIHSPVYAADESGKIAPHYLLWPSFWGTMKGDEIQPAPMETVRRIAAALAKQAEGNPANRLTEEFLTEALKAMAEEEPLEGTPVYLAGGQVYRLDEEGRLLRDSHKAAQPYRWPLAHNVRPAAQSLGVRECEECHSVKAEFFFG